MSRNGSMTAPTPRSGSATTKLVLPSSGAGTASTVYIELIVAPSSRPFGAIVRRMAAPGVARREHTSFVGQLGPSKYELVLQGSTRVSYPAGSVGFHPDEPARTGILESGMARAYVTSAEGRQASIAYGHRGDLLFSAGITGEPFDGSAQFVVDSTVIHLDMPHVRRLVASDVEICRAVAGDMAMWLHHCATVIAIHAFGSVAQRLAFDLLDRAC